MQNLTLKQEAAVQEYIINGGNKTAAYKSIYSTLNWKESTINVKACELFKKPHVAARVKELADKLEEKSDITKEWIVTQLKEVVENSALGEKYDSSGINKALDTLNKMFGYYAPEKKEHSGEITHRRTINLNPNKKDK